jgi:hypothetical protein
MKRIIKPRLAVPAIMRREFAFGHRYREDVGATGGAMMEALLADLFALSAACDSTVAAAIARVRRFFSAR